MKVLITGAKGFVGKNLVAALENLKAGKDRTRPDLKIDEIFQCDVATSPKDLQEYCRQADFVFNFAGVNRPKDNSEFQKGNCDFLSTLLDMLKQAKNTCPVMLASSAQASLQGRFAGSEYGKSKLAAEKVLFAYAEETGAKVFVYRFPNLFGKWCRPKYNSAVATFCWAMANDEPFTVNDPTTELELLYIDDLVGEMLDLLCSKSSISVNREQITVNSCGGMFQKPELCEVKGTYRVTLGEIVELLKEFKQQPTTLLMPKMPAGSFAKKLYSMYLTYLPKDKIKYALKMNVDDRGSFTELLHTADCGQVSINISKPGITKGQHWHNSKWELFIVVQGHGLIQERNMDTGEMVEFEVSGDKIEAVHMIPGWTHNIINLSDTENLVTVMTCNEVFDPLHPDTFAEEV